MKSNEVYGIVIMTDIDGLCTTPNEVYGVRTNVIEMKTSEVYGIST